MRGFSSNADVKSIVDRKGAIAYAIEEADENDVVLLAGKGHESSQIVGDTHMVFDDCHIARECLGTLG